MSIHKKFMGLYWPEKFPFGKTVNITPPSTTPIIPPGSRVSQEDTRDAMSYLESSLEFVKPDWTIEVIELIRTLSKVNPDMAQALSTVVKLGNTGIKIAFDPRVKAEDQDKMKLHIENKMKLWAKSNHLSPTGLTNKMIKQTMIGGAISLEKVMADDLKQGISTLAFVNPETIRFALNKKNGTYDIYQKPKNSTYAKQGAIRDHIKLNPHTFIYIGQATDISIPYGEPPYMASLKALGRQEKMLDNFDHIIDVIGLFGFFQALLEKPNKTAEENEAQYTSRMYSLLDEAKNRILKGYRDGVNVGFLGDTEFEFQSATKNVGGAKDLFIENELQAISGLKSDASMLGRSYGSSEAQITVVFMKMVSELTNMQADIASVWEDIYRTELLHQGFKFESLKVTFKPSTLADDYKLQQARQMKISNAQAEWGMGIINQDKVADILDYDKPDQQKPRVDFQLAKILGSKEKEQKGKNGTAKKKRRKDEGTPKSIEDQRTRKKDAK